MITFASTTHLCSIDHCKFLFSYSSLLLSLSRYDKNGINNSARALLNCVCAFFFSCRLCCCCAYACIKKKLLSFSEAKERANFPPHHKFLAINNNCMSFTTHVCPNLVFCFSLFLSNVEKKSTIHTQTVYKWRA